MIAWFRLLLLVAGLLGASGVAAAAVSAHMAGGASLATAAQFLMIHAAAVAALAAAGLLATRGAVLLLVGASAMAVGTVLFSGDLALRALMDTKLLWGTAPFGGTLMIAGWIAAGIGGALILPRAR
ncbi:DUF423 domain-containing protein [Aquabacter cavernae]|uniref:DUF423 domain-containing protein n=1 Tax=Aquabacter cavernae TaxID=2496029 RepID=UPI000F8E42AF|nr:DUF423 domain-containing protein [Aquabacter cavernae]